MNKSEVIVKAVTAVAKSAGREVDEWGMDVWVDALRALHDDAFDRALRFLREQYRAGKLPSVKQVEDAANQRAEGKNDVDEAVARICAGVRTFGYANVERAREHIGELGWAIVARYGGWQAVCAVETEKDLAVMRAQMKHTGESVRERSSLGILGSAPSLPLPDQPIRPGLQPASALLGQLLPPRK